MPGLPDSGQCGVCSCFGDNCNVGTFDPSDVEWSIKFPSPAGSGAYQPLASFLMVHFWPSMVQISTSYIVTTSVLNLLLY